jgi:hypothetical protein
LCRSMHTLDRRMTATICSPGPGGRYIGCCCKKEKRKKIRKGRGVCPLHMHLVWYGDMDSMVYIYIYTRAVCFSPGRTDPSYVAPAYQGSTAQALAGMTAAVLAAAAAAAAVAVAVAADAVVVAAKTGSEPPPDPPPRPLPPPPRPRPPPLRQSFASSDYPDPWKHPPLAAGGPVKRKFQRAHTPIE